MRAAAEAAGAALVASLSPFAVDAILPVLLDGMELKKLWQTKVASMTLLVALSNTAAGQVRRQLPTIIPIVSGCVADAKKPVKVCCWPCSRSERVPASRSCCALLSKHLWAFGSVLWCKSSSLCFTATCTWGCAEHELSPPDGGV